MSKLESKIHNVIILLLLDDVADIWEGLNSLISDLLSRVVEHLIQQRKNGPDCLIIAFLAILLSDESDQRDKLVQQGTFNVLVLLLGKEFQVWKKTLGEEPAVDLIGKVEKTLSELKLLLLVWLLDELTDLLIGLIHATLVGLALLFIDFFFYLIIRHGDIEAVLLFFHVPSADTPLLELLVHPIGLFVLQVEHLLINQHAVDGTPVAGLWVSAVQVLNLEVEALAPVWELHLHYL